MSETNKKAPKLKHVGKKKNPALYLMISREIMIWVNHNLKLNEMRYLYTLMQCNGDGYFNPSIKYITNMSSLDASSQTRARKGLKDLGIIEHKDGVITIRFDVIEKLAREMKQE